MDAISLKNIAFSYDGKVNAINIKELNILKGKYTCILGSNGSGKTTLARFLAGLIFVKKGEYKILDNDNDLSDISCIRKNIGIVFQNPDNQFVGATVEDDIAFGMENMCIPREKIAEEINYYATKTGMTDYLNKEPTSLSGGQKQRVAIAGILAMKPNIIIFDEATAMLDPKGKKEIFDLINEVKMNDEDLTIISITHDIEEAFNSDQVIVLDKGKVVLQGEPRSVFRQNKNLIKSIKLEQPFLYQFIDELKDNNLDVSEANNMEELVRLLCR